MTASGTHLFWIGTRGAGIAALVLTSLAVVAGLLLGGRLSRRPGRAADLRAVHGSLSVAGLVAIGLHGLLLLGDSWVRPSLADVLVPLQISYRPAWVALGIVAAYGLGVSALAFVARGRLGARRWKLIHRTSALVWVAAVVHAFGAGTDRGQVWFLVPTALVATTVVGLTAVRIAAARSGPQGPRRRPTRDTSPPTPPALGRGRLAAR